MSWYYTYYAGVRTAEGKIYPLGPYTAEGKLKEIASISRSFEPDLHEYFGVIPQNCYTDELKKDFPYITQDPMLYSYCFFDDLPKGDSLKFNYYLITDVQQYQKDGAAFDGFYDYLTPEMYYLKALNELSFGAAADESHSARDYMPFAYIDQLSSTGIASKIREISYLYEDYELDEKFGTGWERIAILSQG